MSLPNHVNKFWNRNPFFYRMRFKLLLRKTHDNEFNNLNYNKYNSKKAIPEAYHTINKSIFLNVNEDLSDMEKTLSIANWLRNNLKGGPGLGKSSTETLNLMINSNYGVCSDFAQVFNNFCVINDLKTREWGINNLDFNGGGHSFNEVYITELNKWMLIDVSKSIYFFEKDKNLPLSAKEVFEKSRLKKTKQYYCFNNSYTNDEKEIEKFFFTDDVQAFIIHKYRNNVYDWFLNTFKKLPIPIVHGLVFLIGKSYTYKLIELPKLNKS